MRAWCALWPRFRGSRARAAGWPRAIPDAVKPMDIASFPYTTSCTLRVTPSLTLYAHIVPIRHRYPVKPLSAHPVTVLCGLLWGVVTHPHLRTTCCVGLKTFCHYASYG